MCNTSYKFPIIYKCIHIHKRTGTASWTSHFKEMPFLLSSTSAQWHWSFQKLTLLETFSIWRWWTTWPFLPPHTTAHTTQYIFQKNTTYSHAKTKALEMSCCEICWWHWSHSVIVLMLDGFCLSYVLWWKVTSCWPSKTSVKFMEPPLPQQGDSPGFGKWYRLSCHHDSCSLASN